MADPQKGERDKGPQVPLVKTTPATQHLVDATQMAPVVDELKATTKHADTASHPLLSTNQPPEQTVEPVQAEAVVPVPHANDILDLMSVPEDSLEGQVVAVRYKVIRKIGEGGMGAVYLAEHVTIEKKVALKVLLHEFARKPVIKERFLQEAKAAAKIGHENIVDIIDFGHTPNGTLFFAMEYMDGKDLADVIQMQGPMPWERLKPIMLQICRGMHAAHDAGIIHRDMKPENIFLMDRGGQKDFVKILDFGIAKVSMGDEGGAKLTRTGMVFGTPQYMSPEQAQGKTPDNRVDIYSVGCIIYELLTAHVPFPGDSFMAILTKHISEEPPPMREIYPDGKWPDVVTKIVTKAMAKNPEHRFQSMADMAKAISRVSEEPPGPDTDKHLRVPGKTPPPEPQLEMTLDVGADELDGVSRGNGRTIAMVLGGLIGVVALVLVIMFTGSKEEQDAPVDPNPADDPTHAAAGAPPVKPAPEPVAETTPDAGPPPTPDLSPAPDKAAPKPKPKVKRRPRPRPRPRPKPTPKTDPTPKPKPKPKPGQKVRDLLDPFG